MICSTPVSRRGPTVRSYPTARVPEPAGTGELDGSVTHDMGIGVAEAEFLVAARSRGVDFAQTMTFGRLREQSKVDRGSMCSNCHGRCGARCESRTL